MKLVVNEKKTVYGNAKALIVFCDAYTGAGNWIESYTLYIKDEIECGNKGVNASSYLYGILEELK